jgi:hypothetical protein
MPIEQTGRQAVKRQAVKGTGLHATRFFEMLYNFTLITAAKSYGVYDERSRRQTRQFQMPAVPPKARGKRRLA